MILVVDMCYRRNSLGFSEFVLSVASTARRFCEVEVRHFSEVNDAREYEKVILCGTALRDDAFLGRIGEMRWLADCETPLLGICAGMQALCMAYGSRLAECKEIGMVEVKTTSDNKLFSGSFKAYELHRHAVEPSDVFTVLAVSVNCVQAVKHKSKELYGVLFHPEVRNQGIIERFTKL